MALCELLACADRALTDRTQVVSGKLTPNDFPTVKRLGEAAFGVTFDGAEAEERLERAGGEPWLFALRGKVCEQMIDFLAGAVFRQRHEKVRRAEVAFVFRNFVFQNRVIAEGVPGELGDEAMVLMEIFAAVGKNEVGLHFALQADEGFLEFQAGEGETGVAELVEGDIFFGGGF